MGLILKENHVIHTNRVHRYLLGSSKWDLDFANNTLRHKIKNPQELPGTCESVRKLRSEIRQTIREEERAKRADRASKRVGGYRLNKKKVREKCHALFTLKRSAKFMAFYSISFPQGIADKEARECLNTWLTRCRTKYNLKNYLWVAERQKNGTIHFHLITNNYMPIREVNRYMAVCIANRNKRYSLGLNIDRDKYNGVDVKRIDNNRKRLGQYLTKYVSKNNTTMDILCYYSSESVSQLFTAEYIPKLFDKYRDILAKLSDVHTLVVDNDFATIEYFTCKDKNGKYFSPPDEWYSTIQEANDLVLANYEAGEIFDKLILN